jgi:hypothetical protein
MRIPLGAALAAAALLAPASAGAVVPGGNLVVNPGAEGGTGSPDAGGVVPPPGWVVTGPFTVVQYGAPDFLTAADSARLGGGANFFAGGPTNPASAAAQTIDVSQAAPEIDAGRVTATLSALLGGFATQEDRATVTATFISATAASLGTVRLQPVTAAERGSVTTLIPRSASGAVPAGTRGIAVRIDAIRDAGAYNDGYIDNVSLTLGSGAAPVYKKTVVVKVVSGKVGIRLPGSKKEVDLTGEQGIPVGSTVDTLHGVVQLSSVPKPGAAPQTAKFYEGEFKVGQSAGLTELTLATPLASCRSGRGRAAAARKAKKRHLWGDGTGAFRTKGKYSSATVRGTKWLVEDSCSGTLTRVVRGTVTVRDQVRHKTIIVKAGKSYRARPSR